MDRGRKIFEIGDGRKSITVPARYCGEMNDEGTLLLYDPACDNVWIRISVMTVASGNGGESEHRGFDCVAGNGRKATTLGDKHYIRSEHRSKEGGEKIITYIYEVGYRRNIIIISITTLLKNARAGEFRVALDEMPSCIASIEDNGDGHRVFEMPNDDRRLIARRVAEVLELSESDVETCHLSGKTLSLMQGCLDGRRSGRRDTFRLQSMGLAFGDYISCRHPDFRWVVVSDGSGRDYALAYKNTTINIFPATMISKRIEEGVEFDLSGLLDGLLEKIMEIEQEEEID
jgi:hypothetical protein